MRVLVACEFSGTVRDAFIRHGHDAWSCDILPTENKGPHIQGDVLGVLGEGWDLMVAHPPCTYLCLAGVRHLHSIPSRNGVTAKIHGKDRMDKMLEAAAFFNALLNAPILLRCIENPVPHRYARDLIGRYTQLVQPWQFGHDERKATCFWLRGVPPLMYTKLHSDRHQRVHMQPDSKDRAKKRSVFFSGIAEAMAEQWGNNPRLLARATPLS